MNQTVCTQRDDDTRRLLIRLSFCTFALAFFCLLPPEISQFHIDSNAAYGADKVSLKPRSNLFSRVSFEVEGVELLSFLESYSEMFGFSFFVDRRVDPSTLLTGSFTDEPFIQALEAILGDVNLSYCVVDDSLLYIGPQEAAGEILLLFALKSEGSGLEEAPRNVLSKLSTTIDFQIRPYSEPKDIFKSFAQRSGLKLSGFDKTPFDLCRGADFRKITAGSLLTVLGVGFNVDYRFDPATSAIKPVAINRTAIVSRYYPQSSVDQFLKDVCVDSKFENKTVNGEKLVYITGPFSELAKVELVASQNSRNDSAESSRDENYEKISSSKASNKKVQISGEVSNATLRSLFAYLEKNARVVCSLDPSLESNDVTLETRVSCKFTNSNIDQIAQIVSKQIGARPEIDGNSITFYAK